MFQAGGSIALGRMGEYDPEAALNRLDWEAAHPTAAGRQPLVIGQLGQSLDGRIATPTGASKYINGDEALRHLHRIRARVDALVIGVGTALADDPSLTTRHVEGPNPARVVIDPHGRMPGHLAMLRDSAAPVISVTCPGATVPKGVEQIEIPCKDGLMRPGDIVGHLAERGFRRILVEGGAETLARFIDAGAIDELHLMVAPIILGSGKTGLNLSPICGLDEAMRPAVRMMRFRDGDMLLLCDLLPAMVA